MNTSNNQSNQSQSVHHLATIQADDASFALVHKSPLFRTLLEGLIDGILILTEQGKLVDANHSALQLCRQCIEDLSSPSEVPQQIWRICQALIESRQLFPDCSIVLEDEINTDRSTPIRIRARWMDLHDTNRPYLLVVLEDRCQSLRNSALSEAHKYGLTTREAEIWLLRRANCTYKAIADQLHIALNTVKKHVKSIHAKRDAVL